jgi:hypothetical protein
VSKGVKDILKAILNIIYNMGKPAYSVLEESDISKIIDITHSTTIQITLILYEKNYKIDICMS